MTSHKCFISFKTEDISYKNKIQSLNNLDIIDKSLNEAINSEDENYIMRVIRRDHLKDSTVTICLIGTHSAENSYFENQQYIKRELQASLYQSPNGILGIVLPEMYGKVFQGDYKCSECGETHNYVAINDNTVIKEFSYNYYLPCSKCSWGYDDEYCVLVKWDNFLKNPNEYIEMAYKKRISNARQKIKVFPK